MAEPKTWVLTKTTSYPPNDFRLQLGQVLSDPRLPMSPLFPTSLNPPPVMAGMQVAENTTKGVVLGKNSSLGQCFGLWANTSVVPADATLAAALANNTWWEWRLDELLDRGTWFSRDHIRAIVNDATVKDYIRSQRVGTLGTNFCPPLYVVTGLRIAKRAKMEMASTRVVSRQLQIRVNVTQNNTPAANLGLLAQATRLRQDHASFKEANDFIFAYQLSEISYFLTVRQKTYTHGDSQAISGSQSEQKKPEQDEVFDVPEEPLVPYEDGVDVAVPEDTNEGGEPSAHVNITLEK
jgi:hypothetical protein